MIPKKIKDFLERRIREDTEWQEICKEEGIDPFSEDGMMIYWKEYSYELEPYFVDKFTTKEIADFVVENYEPLHRLFYFELSFIDGNYKYTIVIFGDEEGDGYDPILFWVGYKEPLEKVLAEEI